MGVKITILILIYTAFLSYDFRLLIKQRLSDKLVYAAVVLFTLYMSLLYALDLKWPFLHDLADVLYNPPAHRIVDTLKAPEQE